MGKMKEIDTKLKEMKRSVSRRKSFKVTFKSEELPFIVFYSGRRSRRTEESSEDLVHSSKEY